MLTVNNNTAVYCLFLIKIRNMMITWLDGIHIFYFSLKCEKFMTQIDIYIFK